MQTFRILASVSLLFACTPKEADTDGGSSSGAQTDGASATSATGGNPTTGATTTTGADPTTAQTASSAPDPTTTTTTTPSTTTANDTDGVSPPGACAAVCAHWDACSPGIVGPVGECTASCVDDFGEIGECTAAIGAQWSCVAGLSCEEALKFIQSTPTSCLPEIQAADEACMDQGCAGEVGGGEDSCEFQQQCDGNEQAIVCDAGVCTCSDNGVPGKECPMDGLCQLDGKGLYEAVDACCGFMWE